MVSAKVQPVDDALDDDDDDDDEALFAENCCCRFFVRVFCILLVFAWMSTFVAAIAVPYMFRVFHSLSDDERMWISIASGGVFAALTLCCCCVFCCCCCICQAADKDEEAASKASSRRSSLSLEWATRVLAYANEHGMLSERHSQDLTAGVRRMSINVISVERGILERSSSLRRASIRRPSASVAPPNRKANNSKANLAATA